MMPRSPGPPIRAVDAPFLPWQPLDLDRQPGLVDSIARETGLALAGRLTGAQAADLPFFPGVALTALSFSELSYDIFAFTRDGALAGGGMLDGGNGPFYATADETLDLTRDNIALYVRCFFHFVRGALGWFHLVGGADDIPWQPDAPAALRAEAAALLVPLTLFGQDSAGRFHLTSTVLFKTALFRTDIVVALHASTSLHPEDDARLTPGQSELCNEILLLEDLPLQDTP